MRTPRERAIDAICRIPVLFERRDVQDAISVIESAIKEAVAAEREANAQMAEEMATRCPVLLGAYTDAMVRAIRARDQGDGA